MTSSRLFVLLFLASFIGFSQLPDCTMGLGSAEPETITTIFQLNEKQVGTMETLRGKLQLATKNLEDQAKKLFEDHPQSNEAELMVLAQKYKALQKKMVDMSRDCDVELLKTFNEKQYQRYLDLCQEAFRHPLNVIPAVYNDSIPPR